MPVLNHHVVTAMDSAASARFFSEMLGFAPATWLGELAFLEVSGDTALVFTNANGNRNFDRQHYAFLVTETEFDEILDRVRGRGLRYWSDPMHTDPGAINRWDDGRGVYFNDPDGHRLEIITRPYGSGGTDADNVHPLVAGTGSDS